MNTKFYDLLGVVLRPAYKLLFPFSKVTGEENIPAEGGYILVSNHRSGYDPLFLAIGSKRQIHFMSKAELMAMPVIGWILRKAQCFGVSRGSGDTGALDTAVNYLQDGEVVHAYTEADHAVTGAGDSAAGGREKLPADGRGNGNGAPGPEFP